MKFRCCKWCGHETTYVAKPVRRLASKTHNEAQIKISAAMLHAKLQESSHYEAIKLDTFHLGARYVLTLYSARLYQLGKRWLVYDKPTPTQRCSLKTYAMTE